MHTSVKLFNTYLIVLNVIFPDQIMNSAIPRVFFFSFHFIGLHRLWPK